MPQPIAFDAWEPDKSDRINPTAEAKGCISIAGQYGPFPDIQNYGPASTVDSFTKILLHMDGADATTAFPDDAPTPHTFTASGNAQIDTAQSKFGGASGLFDGTGDALTTPDSADFTLGSGAWTVDFWFNCTATGGTVERLYGQMDNAASAASRSIFGTRGATNTMQGFATLTGPTESTVTGVTQFTDVLNAGWHHYAFVRTGNTLKLFIDGLQEGGDVAFVGTVVDSANQWAIGQAGELASNQWTGWLDEFRLSVGINRYATADTPDSFTKILLHMNGADGATLFPDHGATPSTWTANGNAQVDTAQSKFGGASGLFDGTGDFVTTPDSANFTLGSGDFTVDFWFNANDAGGTSLRLCGQCDAAATNASVSFFALKNAANVMTGSVGQGGSLVTVTGTTAFTNAVNVGWHHYALVRTGGVLKLFIDGLQEGSDTAIAGAVNDSTNNWSLGRRGENAAGEWNGWLDEFRLSVGVARWTANFTPPTAAYNQGFAVPTNPYNFGGGGANAVLGADTFYDSTTAPAIFFGDSSKLYTLVSRMAIDVSKAGGYAIGGSDTWQFAQFGNNVVAVSRNTAPQHYTMGTSVDFANLAGSPPSGTTSVARVSDFLWLGKDFTVNWSGFNNITAWTPDPGTQAGNQVLDQERGEIMALVGLDYAAIFQERGVRRAIYVGPPVTWDFGQDYVEKARGCIARNAAVAFGRVIFYAADDGFYAFDGQSSTPIGYGKVDQYFTSNLNYAFRHKVACGVDYSRKLVVFGFPAGSNQFISELLMFSIQDGRWTHDVLDLEFLFDTPAEPFNVDNFSLLFPANDLDGVIIPNDIDSSSFDDRRIRLAGFFTGTHQLGLFTGAARAATIDTKEFEPAPGQRALLTEVWPMGDYPVGTVSASVGYRRALPGADLTFTNPTQMNRVGFCPQRIDARFMRIRQQITAGAAWRRGEGIHFTATPTGGR